MKTLKKGSLVQILGSNKIGEVANILEKEKKAIVAFGKCEMLISLNILKAVPTNAKLSKIYQQPKSGVNINIERPRGFTNFQTEIDFHGFFVQEAIDYLEILIDKALVAGQKSLIIIHGKGSGVLRTAIRQYLKKHKHIKITKAPLNSYDDGITHVDLI